jgi:cyclic pyranopterin phosphate synthase
MPEEGIKLLKHSDILTFNEITGFTATAVKMGVNKIRITGGEPLVRKGIVTLVNMLASIKGIEDFGMTTNGILLAEFADDLRRAGLKRINISLDTINPERFSEITRGGDLNDVLNGIEAAIGCGLNPVKINCVVKESNETEDARMLADYCSEKGLEIRYIRQMDLVNGHFSMVQGGSGGDCSHCNRLRLTADGKLKPCLFNDLEFNIRETGYEEAIRNALDLKPECGSINSTRKFFNIGG